MNEKFFDLKKEKQDRIINGAMKVFAREGYAHASTDEMVREAQISKGLLFHYFGSKQGLYGFLTDYSVRFMTLELSRSLSGTESDYFVLQEQLLRAWTDAMRQYPFIRMFLAGAEKETAPEAVEQSGTRMNSYRKLMREIEGRYSYSRFLPGVDAHRMTEVVRYTMDALFADTAHMTPGGEEALLKEATAYLALLRGVSYQM